MDEAKEIGGASAEPAKRAYIVDDDEPFRKSLAMLLATHGWSVETFDSPAAFVDRAPALAPGLLLLDLELPGKSGLDLLESNDPELERFAIVMVTGAGAIQTAVRSIKAGAIDFVEKPFTPDELVERLDKLNSTLDRLLRGKAIALDSRRRVALLSQREREVLECLLSGASNKLIARFLDVSPRTVEMHRARMVKKLSVATTAEALELARQAGIDPVTVDASAGSAAE